MSFKKILSVFFITVSFFNCTTAFANKPHHYYSEDGYFLIFYAQAGGIFWDKQPGNFTVKFPYTITTDNSPVYHGLFSVSKNNLVGQGRFFYNFPGLEFGKNNFSGEANYSFGGPTMGWSDNFYFGMTYRFHFGRFQDNPDRFCFASVNFPGERLQKNCNPFYFSFSAGLQFYHPLFNLGTIQTQNGLVTALGSEMNSNDGTVNVYFQQNVEAFTPAFSIERKSENGVSFSIRAGPVIPIKESGGFRFSFQGWDSDHDSQQSYFLPKGSAFDYVKFGAYGLTANMNDVPVEKTPFHLCDWMISFHIGFVLD